MKKKHVIRRRVISSAMSLVMCAGMLSGMTTVYAAADTGDSQMLRVVGNNPDSTMDVWTMTSNENVFRDFVKNESSSEVLEFDCVRNEFESAQILFRDSAEFDITGVKFGNLVCGDNLIDSSNMKYNYVEYEYLSGNSAGHGASTVLPAGREFPDALSNEESVSVEANSTQPVWIRVYVPKGTPAGTYTGTVEVATTDGDFEVPMQVQVYDVMIPDSADAEFSFSFWSNIAGTWELNDDMDQIKRLYGYDRYSDEWWQLVGNIADLMRENRSNNLYINPLTLVKDGPGTRIDEEGNYHFDWSRFDEYIEFFMDKGVVKQLEGMTLLACQYGSDYLVYTLTGEPGEALTRETLTWDDPQSQKWLEQFIPAYVQHITEKGWDEIWIQHIGDEPFNVEAQTTKWGAVRDMIRELNPNIRCGDAVDNSNAFSAVQNLDSDIYFPLLSVHEGAVENCDQLRAEGKEVYMYTCQNPTGSWLNRLVDKPVWQMKTIGWLSYMRGATGHLHWGFNEWFKHPTNVYNTVERQSSKGDNFTIYPDVDMVTDDSGNVLSSTPRRPAVKSSIRYDAVRDACEDYEIFKVLEQRDETLAKEIAGSIVTSGNNYVTDTAVMIEQRKVLLEQASLKNITSAIEQISGDNVGEVQFIFDTLPEGCRYFYYITEGQADSSLGLDSVGGEKPAAYENELISGTALKIDNGNYLNVVEVDDQNSVVTYVSLRVTKSKQPAAADVPLSSEITMVQTDEKDVYTLSYETVLGENQIVNGDFEKGGEGWTNIKNFTVSDDGIQGSKSAKVGMPEGGSEQQLPYILPDTTYIFKASGKVTKDGEKGWATVENSDRSLKIDLEFTGTEYEEIEQVITTPAEPNTYKALTWKNDAVYGGFNDTYFYADNISLCSVDVEVGNGHVYYAMSDTTQQAPALEVGDERPEEYDVLLKKDSRVTLKEGECLNVIEVDREDRVVAMKTLQLNEDKTISTAVLEYALSLAETADTEGAVDSVVKNFNDAKAAAEDILARAQAGDTSVTQEMVDESWKDLLKAMQYLSFKQGDKTDLQKVIDLAGSLDLSKYLTEGQQAFTDALAAAEAVLADGDAMQDEVGQSWRELLKAMSGLRLKPSKDALEDLISQAQAVDTADYTEETVAVFTKALAHAIEIFNDEEADEASVKEAENALKECMEQLVKNEEQDPDGNTADGDDAGTAEPGGTDTGTNGAEGSSQNTAGKANASVNANHAVKTGDETGVLWGSWMLSVLTAVSAVTAVIVKGRRRGQ